MPHAACSSVFSVSPAPRASALNAWRQPRLQRQHDLLRRHRSARRIRRRQPRALIEARKRPPPDADRGRPILPGEPRQIVAVRRRPRQRRAIAASARTASAAPPPAPAPTSRPSACDGCSATADADRAPSRTSANRSSGGAVTSNRSSRSCASNRRQPRLLLRLVQRRQVDLPPRHLGPRSDHLHRPVQALMPEARPQAWRGAPAGPAPQPAAAARRARPRARGQLHRIDVRAPRIVKRMEQQALLQRRQRQDVLERRIPAAPAARSRPATARPAASRRACGRRHPAAPHDAPAPPARRTSPPPARGPPPRPAAPAPKLQCAVSCRPGRAIQRQRVDLERVRQRHRRDRRRRASASASGRRRSSPRRRRRQTGPGS